MYLEMLPFYYLTLLTTAYQLIILCFTIIILTITLRTSLKFDTNFPFGDKRWFWMGGGYNFCLTFISNMFVGSKSFLAFDSRFLKDNQSYELYQF